MEKQIIILITGLVSFAFSGQIKSNQEEYLDSGPAILSGKISKEISYQRVTITDKFWRPRIDNCRLISIRAALKEAANDIDNFDIAAGKKKGKHIGGVGSDSNVFKIIQGVAYTLSDTPDSMLETTIDSLINRIVAAQQPDGYLFTYWTINDLSKKWTDIARKHELYCGGHLIEAAIAYYEVTGKRKLLDAAIRYANYIDSVFGPNKKEEAPGHEEIELALYKLYKATENKKYLMLSAFFINERGNPKRMVAEKIAPPDNDPNANTPNRWRPPSYMQDHLPVSRQFYAVGHAVRATYLYSAMADISLQKKDAKYLPALNAIWNDIVGKKMYITGGIGTRQFHDEGFGSAYLLPNNQAYCETCSGIGFTFWNRRMNLLTGNAKFADMVELTMYNAALAGISLSGDRFFYTNPLESNGKVSRQKWDNPPCCPTNLVRFLPEIGSTIYSNSEEAVYINQFIGNKAKIPVGNQEISVNMETGYPWNGNIKLKIDPSIPVNFSLYIRIPGWASEQLIKSDLYHYVTDKTQEAEEIILKVNGNRIPGIRMVNGYAVIHRNWRKGDQVELELPMRIKLVAGNANIEDTRGKIALTRGPLVYCIEETDNKIFFEKSSDAYQLSSNVTASYENDLLNGVVTIHATGFAANKENKISITAIPYYAWCNREQGQMKVWLPYHENIY